MSMAFSLADDAPILPERVMTDAGRAANWRAPPALRAWGAVAQVRRYGEGQAWPTRRAYSSIEAVV
jgi:hypothetical protein